MTAPHAMMSASAPQPPAGAGPAAPEASEEMTVETRFGPLTCAPQAVIDMPQGGPLGFAQHRRFALLDLPNPQLARFRLLQSLADPELSFVVVPTDRDGGLIAPKDVDEACAAAGIEPADAVILLIVTVRRTPKGTSMTANLRAPVMLDVKRRTARQIVLSNPDYPIQHAL